MNHRFLFLLIAITILKNTSSVSQNYFQQEVNYKINVKLDDTRSRLYANESIDYTNNSEQTLTFIWFHLWPNAYKDRSTALCKQLLEGGNKKMFFAEPKNLGYIDSLNFKVDGEKVAMIIDSIYSDVCMIILNKPLPPKGKINITTPFRVKIPSASFSRLGHINQAYYITQWYPKPAVFDQFGWHQMPYLNQGEFYSEFGSYEVSITLPKNYVIGATGDLQNEDELKWLDEKSEITKKIVLFSNDNSFPPSDSASKTLVYKQSRIHDFAWFADKRFNVLKGELTLPQNKNKVTLWSMFTNQNAALWKNSIQYIHDGAYKYSLWNGDYQYNQITAIDGSSAAGGGMEYPNVTIINTSENAFELEDVIVHEVGHNWFYGMLGSNERIHGWMDEGLNSFNEMRYWKDKYQGSEAIGKNSYNSGDFMSKLIGFNKIDFSAFEYASYLYSARPNTDQPIETKSKDFTNINYGTIMYSKTALIFDYLKSYLGDSLFDICMKKYFDEWKFKHPYPEDLRKIFETTTGKNLNWFFDDLIKTKNKLDYKISCAKKQNDQSYKVFLKNKNEIVSPVSISAVKNGVAVTTKWIDGFEKSSSVNFAAGSYDRFQVNYDSTMPEINSHNNFIRTHGILKKCESPKIEFITALENQSHPQLFISPVIGWNNYDKTMLGMSFYNIGIIEKKFEYFLMPMYSFGTNSLTGKAGIYYNYHQLKAGDFQLSSFVQRYFYYRGDFYIDQNASIANKNMDFIKLNPELKFTLKNKDKRSPIRHQLSLNAYYIWNNDEYVKTESGYQPQYSSHDYYDLGYRYSNNRTLDPYFFKTDIENGNDYTKLQAELNYNFSFKREKKGLSIRVFAGTFLQHEDNSPVSFQMSGLSGTHDYLYNTIYLGRSETDGIFSKQFTEKDGGFKIYSPVGRTNKWLVSTNIKLKFPGLPLLFYMDLGTYDNAKNAFEGSKALMFDGGICISLIRDVVEIYFPLFASSDIKQYYDVNDKNKFKEKISFQLNINLVDPFVLSRQLFQ